MTTDPSFVPAQMRGRRRRDFALLGGLFVAVLIGLGGLAAATGWQETIDQLQKLGLWQVVILLALSLVNYVLRAVRWHFFAKCLGLPTDLWQNTRHFVGGFAMSVTPGRIGELIRMRWIKRETGWTFERTAPLALVDRASDLAAMALILGATIALSSGKVAYAFPVTFLALTAAIIVTRPVLLSGLANGFYRTTGLFARVMVRIRRASVSLGAFSTPKTMIVTVGLGLIGWFSEGYAFYLLLMWMDADIGFWMAIMIFVFSTLAGGLTGAPGGIGGAEAAMIALLLMEGIAPEIALPATAVIRITTLWFAIIIGLVVFPHAERLSKGTG